MPEVEVQNLVITPKPKCLRCGSEHVVRTSDIGCRARYPARFAISAGKKTSTNSGHAANHVDSITLRALRNTSSNIASVSFPVCVFCWLG